MKDEREIEPHFWDGGPSFLEFPHGGGGLSPNSHGPRPYGLCFHVVCMLTSTFACFLHRVGVHRCMPPILKHSHALRGCSRGNWVPSILCFPSKSYVPCLLALPQVHVLHTQHACFVSFDWLRQPCLLLLFMPCLLAHPFLGKRSALCSLSSKIQTFNFFY